VAWTMQAAPLDRAAPGEVLSAEAEMDRCCGPTWEANWADADQVQTHLLMSCREDHKGAGGIRELSQQPQMDICRAQLFSRLPELSEYHIVIVVYAGSLRDVTVQAYLGRSPRTQTAGVAQQPSLPPLRTALA
jgi:hypothetical protein